MGKIGLEIDHSVLIDLGNQSTNKINNPRKSTNVCVEHHSPCPSRYGFLHVSTALTWEEIVSQCLHSYSQLHQIAQQNEDRSPFLKICMTWLRLTVMRTLTHACSQTFVCCEKLHID